jgi:hypothetical protein
MYMNGSPTGNTNVVWAAEGGGGGVVVVVGVPAGELGGEHEVDAVLFGDGGGFVFFGPRVDVALDGEVVVG